LCDRAVGTSGAGTHQFYVHGKRYGHILDPRSGYPADGVLSSTVVAPLASVADALSTAFYVLGQEEATRYCAEHSEVSALIMTAGRRGGVDVHRLNCDGLDWNYVDPAEEAPADATDELASAAIRRPDSTARSDGERGPGG
jgi:thiamine biosynthesis lipoprotein